MERHDEHSRAHPEPEPAPGKPGVTQPESTEHGTTQPRTDSTEPDAEGRYEGMPEEGPGAGDAARVYAEDDPKQRGTAQRRDRGGEGLVDKIRSALGQNERPDDRPGERPADWRDEPQAGQQAERRDEAQAGQQAEREGYAGTAPSGVEGRTDAAAQDQYRPEERQPYASRPESAAGTAAPTADEAVTSRERTEAEADGDARPAPGSVGTADADTDYDAAAERKAVGATDADATPRDATRTERAADAMDQRSADETSGSEAQTSPGAVTLVEQTAVISAQDAQTFQARWETIQGRFIDDPHAATEQADELVGEVMERLASLRQEYLRQLRGALGDGSDTEAMRVALQRYRAFFQLLLG
jgi:hypothetical protein